VLDARFGTDLDAGAALGAVLGAGGDGLPSLPIIDICGAGVLALPAAGTPLLIDGDAGHSLPTPWSDD
jgi:hypothetical protein